MRIWDYNQGKSIEDMGRSLEEDGGGEKEMAFVVVQPLACNDYVRF